MKQVQWAVVRMLLRDPRTRSDIADARGVFLGSVVQISDIKAKPDFARLLPDRNKCRAPFRDTFANDSLAEPGLNLFKELGFESRIECAPPVLDRLCVRFERNVVLHESSMAISTIKGEDILKLNA